MRKRKKKKQSGGGGLALITLLAFCWLAKYSLNHTAEASYEVSVFSVLPTSKPYRTHDKAALVDLWAEYSKGELKHDLPEDE